MSKKAKQRQPRKPQLSKKEWKRLEAREIRLSGSTNFGTIYSGTSRALSGGLPSLGKRK
jgi:hypothetical protein